MTCKRVGTLYTGYRVLSLKTKTGWRKVSGKRGARHRGHRGCVTMCNAEVLRNCCAK